jgi:hypothetical protein
LRELLNIIFACDDAGEPTVDGKNLVYFVNRSVHLPPESPAEIESRCETAVKCVQVL